MAGESGAQGAQTQDVGNFAPSQAQNTMQAWVPQSQQNSVGQIAGLQPSQSEAGNSLSTQFTPQQGQQALMGNRGSEQLANNDKPWYNGLIHGGGDNKMTSDEARQRGVLMSQYSQESDPAIKAQLKDQMDQISAGASDRGGILGSIGRVATGRGLGTTENLLGVGFDVAAPILKAMYAKHRADQLTGKVLANQNQVRQNQQAFMQSGLS